jgi:hypothetical protein
MHSFLRLARKAITGQDIASDGSGLLFFTPDRLVAGITFHLLENGIAISLDRNSSGAVLQKLGQRLQNLSISKAHWSSMDNFQRLQWLLNQSGIIVNFNPYGASTLDVR